MTEFNFSLKQLLEKEELILGRKLQYSQQLESSESDVEHFRTMLEINNSRLIEIRKEIANYFKEISK